MTLQEVLFKIFGGLAIVSAAGLVLSRHVVYGALFLGLCLTMVAGLYALLGADFLFAAQILIYVTAIAVIFLFAILLAGRRAELQAKPFNPTVVPGLLTAILTFALLGSVVWQARQAWSVLAPSPEGTTAAIGDLLMGPYAVGVEILGVILLVSLVGATLLAQNLKSQPGEASNGHKDGALATNGHKKTPVAVGQEEVAG